MRHYTYAFVLILFPIFGFSQIESKSDSNAAKGIDDSSKIMQYIEYSTSIINEKPKEAIEIAIKAIDLANKKSTDKLIAKSYENLANVYFNNNDYQLSIQNFYKAIEYFQKIENQEKIALLYNRIGVIFFRQANYISSYEYYNKSLEIREAIDDKKGISSSYNNIGILFQNQGLYKEALEYHFKGIKINEKINEKNGLASSHNNIGEIYRETDSLEKALFHYTKSLMLYKEANDKNGIATINMNLAQIYRAKGQLDSAFILLDHSSIIAKEINDLYKLSEVYNYYGDCYYTAKKYDLAISNYLKGYEISIEKGTPEITKYATKKLSLTYSTKKNYKKAFLAIVEYLQIEDSIKTSHTVQQFIQQKMQQNFNKILKQKQIEEKEQEIAHKLKAKKQNIILIAFSIGLLSLLIISFLLIRNNRIKFKANRILKQRNSEINQQKEEIQTQHSHLENLNTELVKQKEEITNQRNNLERLNFELFEQKEQIEEEKVRSDKLIKNILPDAIASELMTNKRVRPHYYKHTTVMFTDFVDFTKLSKELTLLDLVNELDTYFAEFDGIIEKHNIEKIKTIGDSYLCVGGIPKANKSNPISVVLAGLEIQRFMARINRLQSKLKFPIWQIRIGIHTGEVFTGVVGKKKFAYEVLGETIYVASRIEDFCKIGSVTISETTYDEIKDYFNCNFIQEIELKFGLKQKIFDVQSIKENYSIKEEGKVPNSSLFKIIKEMN